LQLKANAARDSTRVASRTYARTPPRMTRRTCTAASVYKRRGSMFSRKLPPNMTGSCEGIGMGRVGGGKERVARHTSHVTRHTSHVAPHTSNLTPHTSHHKTHTSHVTPQLSYLTPHTSHVTRHTSHVTPHTSHPIPPSTCGMTLICSRSASNCTLHMPWPPTSMFPPQGSTNLKNRMRRTH